MLRRPLLLRRPASPARRAARRGPGRIGSVGLAAAFLVGALVAAVPATALADPVVPAAPPAPAVAAAVPAVPAPPAPVWGTCTRTRLQKAGAQCTYVTVPKDYADRSAGTIRLAVSRILHTTARYQGVVLVNPGGPGGSGLGLATLGSAVPLGAGQSYDWIGFDPRGVGSSIPAVHCDRSYLGWDRPDYVATTPALQQAWLARAKAFAQGCAANTDPALLRNMTTRDNALDMDSIRLALGQSQITFYGFSYGTYLGQVYATLFPGHLRRAVLDSNVDPTRVWYQANLDQDVAFERNSQIFFAWLAKYDSVYHLGSTQAAVSALYYGILDQLRRQPQAGGRLGPDEWNDVIVPAPYYQQTWLGVADIFAAAARGDFGPALAAYTGPTRSADNGQGVYNATECTDAPWPTSYTDTWRPDALRLAAQYPFLTWNNVWFNAACLFWPAPARTPVTVDGSQAPPVLLIDETLDAATPYSGSLQVRSLFPSSVLVASPGGTSHAVSLEGVTCVDNTVARYLADGTLPQRQPGTGADKTCRPAPEPVPGAAAAAPAPVAVGAPGVVVASGADG